MGRVNEMTLRIGGSPPLPKYLRCDIGPEHATCDDRKVALESIDRRIGELYRVEDCESILIDLGTWQRCFIALATTRNGSGLSAWNFAECETLTIAMNIRGMYA